MKQLYTIISENSINQTPKEETKITFLLLQNKENLEEYLYIIKQWNHCYIETKDKEWVDNFLFI